jgi:hypothetical protein
LPMLSGKYPTFWGRLRNKIAERDGHKCRSPLCRSTDNRIHVHHIDFDTSNCSEENLIAVCPSCNQRARFDRGLWTAILSAWNRWRCSTGNFDLDKRSQIELNT